MANVTVSYTEYKLLETSVDELREREKELRESEKKLKGELEEYKSFVANGIKDNRIIRIDYCQYITPTKIREFLEWYPPHTRLCEISSDLPSSLMRLLDANKFVQLINFDDVKEEVHGNLLNIIKRKESRLEQERLQLKNSRKELDATYSNKYTNEIVALKNEIEALKNTINELHEKLEVFENENLVQALDRHGYKTTQIFSHKKF